MNWWHQKTYYPIQILPIFFKSSFIYEYNIWKKGSISGISGILSLGHFLCYWCKWNFPRTDTSEVLSQAEVVRTKVPSSKFCPKNSVSKCWEEEGIWEISKEEDNEIGQGWGRLALKLCSQEMWCALHFSSRAGKYFLRRPRAEEFRNFLTAYFPLFWSFISWSIAQPILGCEGVALGRQPPRCVSIRRVQRQKEFKKTPLPEQPNVLSMKLLTELYSICSTQGPDETEILSCVNCDSKELSNFHLPKTICWVWVFFF